MRNNQPVTQREFPFPEQQRLISTTDLQGNITYCNDAFAEVSGYSRDELLGAPHNLVRHPEMPPAVFVHMWQALRQGEPWMGIIKNRRKNGDYYWVNAYVTPVLDPRKAVIGYESVRTKPDADQVRRAGVLYARINAGKPAIAGSERWLAPFWQCLPYILTSQIGVLVGVWLGPGWGFALAALLAVPLALIGLNWQQRGIPALLGRLKQSTSAPLIARLYSDNRGTLARLETAILAQGAHLGTCLTRLQDNAEQLGNQARQAHQLVHGSSQGLQRQREETEQIATAINQMAATTQEVASNVGQAAQATSEANRLIVEGRAISGETRDVMQRLSGAVAQTAEAVNQLAHDSLEIGSVVDVIKSIADQTNLLALNAAIEAARAGESGRGFAVVADEVRNLAKRTGDATGQIHQLIEKLQQQARNAVGTTDEGRKQADQGVEKVLLADQALVGISQAMENIADMSRQIASAAEQQSAVSEEISRNIVNIAQLAEKTASNAQNTAQLSEGLSATVQEQYSLVERFNR